MYRKRGPQFKLFAYSSVLANQNKRLEEFDFLRKYFSNKNN